MNTANPDTRCLDRLLDQLRHGHLPMEEIIGRLGYSDLWDHDLPREEAALREAEGSL